MKSLFFLFTFLSSIDVIICSQPFTRKESPVTRDQLDYLRNKQQEQFETEQVRQALQELPELLKTSEGREKLCDLGLVPLSPPLLSQSLPLIRQRQD